MLVVVVEEEDIERIGMTTQEMRIFTIEFERLRQGKPEQRTDNNHSGCRVETCHKTKN